MAKKSSRGSKRPQKKQVNTEEIKKSAEKNMPPGEKFEFSLKNKKMLAAIPFAVMLILFILVWTTENPKVIDPWFRAAQMVDSSRKVDDPALQKELLEQGGQRLRELVKEHPYHARVHFLLGFYYTTAQKYDSAITELKVAINRGKGGLVNQVEFQAADLLAQAALNKAIQEFQTGDQKQSINTLSEAIEYNPRSPELYAQLGMVYHQLQQLDSAGVYYKKALKLNPQIQPARNNYAQIEFFNGTQLLKQNKVDKAMKHYKQAFNFGNENPQLMNNIGQNLMAKNRPGLAVRFFQQAVNAKPDFADAKNNLKIAKQMTGQK
ncbi:MAG: tetratricopeptide repeat protein [Candidatus Kapaibacterium sp.]